MFLVSSAYIFLQDHFLAIEQPFCPFRCRFLLLLLSFVSVVCCLPGFAFLYRDMVHRRLAAVFSAVCSRLVLRVTTGICTLLCTTFDNTSMTCRDTGFDDDLSLAPQQCCYMAPISLIECMDRNLCPLPIDSRNHDRRCRDSK